MHRLADVDIRGFCPPLKPPRKPLLLTNPKGDRDLFYRMPRCVNYRHSMPDENILLAIVPIFSAIAGFHPAEKKAVTIVKAQMVESYFFDPNITKKFF